MVDLHGDLAPAILGRLSPESRLRVVAVDATLPPVPGVAALVPDGPRDRAAAHLVAALKRLSPDGTDLYWGFRLERIFDTFVRLALETGGSLTDLYDLLTNPDRRDAARLATRSVELARFLDELSPVVRRNPEFLWSASTRLSKVVLVPALRELLAPEEGGLPVEALLTEGRSLLVRLPFASLGPEAAAFAATLLLGRIYLGVAATAERRGRPFPVSVVLDEVQATPPGRSPRSSPRAGSFVSVPSSRRSIPTDSPGRCKAPRGARSAGSSRSASLVRRPWRSEVGWAWDRPMRPNYFRTSRPARHWSWTRSPMECAPPPPRSLHPRTTRRDGARRSTRPETVRGRHARGGGKRRDGRRDRTPPDGRALERGGRFDSAPRERLTFGDPSVSCPDPAL